MQIGRSYKATNKYWSARSEFYKEIDLHSRYEFEAGKEMRKLRKHVWYLRIIDQGPSYLLSLVFWAIPIISLLCFVYFMKRTGEFFRPDKVKIVALVLFVFLFPFPMFILVAAGILPPFIWYLMVGGFSSAVLGGWNLFGFLAALVVYLVMMFVCYLLICGFYKILRPKSLMWVVIAALVIVSFVNIDYFASPTGARWTSAVSIYKGYFDGIAKPSHFKRSIDDFDIDDE